MNKIEFCISLCGDLSIVQMEILEKDLGRVVGVGVIAPPLSDGTRLLPVIKLVPDYEVYHVVDKMGVCFIADKESLQFYGAVKEVIEMKHSLPESGKESVLVQYIKKGRHNKKVGLFYAYKKEFGTGSDDYRTVLGHSLCNKKDAFSKELALSIAKGRANSTHVKTLPQSIEKDFRIFKTRCLKFFQDVEFFDTYHMN